MVAQRRLLLLFVLISLGSGCGEADSSSRDAVPGKLSPDVSLQEACGTPAQNGRIPGGSPPVADLRSSPRGAERAGSGGDGDSPAQSARDANNKNAQVVTTVPRPGEKDQAQNGKSKPPSEDEADQVGGSLTLEPSKAVVSKPQSDVRQQPSVVTSTGTARSQMPPPTSHTTMAGQPQVNVSNTTARSPLPVTQHTATTQQQQQTPARTLQPTQVTTTNRVTGNIGLNFGVFRGVKMPVGVDAQSIPVDLSASRSESNLKRAIASGRQPR